MISSARTSRPMESPRAWPDLNVGYKNGWTGSRSYGHDRGYARGTRQNRYAACLARKAYRTIWGHRGHRKRVEIADFAVWHFEDGQVAEISTIQDQFALLKQIGYLPDEV